MRKSGYFSIEIEWLSLFTNVLKAQKHNWINQSIKCIRRMLGLCFEVLCLTASTEWNRIHSLTFLNSLFSAAKYIRFNYRTVYGYGATVMLSICAFINWNTRTEWPTSLLRVDLNNNIYISREKIVDNDISCHSIYMNMILQ